MVASLQVQSTNKSLHSNRDYEVGIVYMDSYKRATTALASRYNTVFVPPASSKEKNHIQVTIPTNMTAPGWAETYKFVLKQSKGAYNIIYSNTYYYDESTTSYWFRLVGQDQALVEEGTELIVKIDSNGIMNTDVKVVVLDKVSQPANFLHLAELTAYYEVPGLYIRLRALDFSVNTTSQNACIPSGGVVSSIFTAMSGPSATEWPTGNSNRQAIVNYPCYTGNASDGYQRIAIPLATIVTFEIEFRRDKQSGPFHCNDDVSGAFLCKVTHSIAANQDYSDVKSFWDAQGIGSILINLMDCEAGDCQSDLGPNTNTYYPTLYQSSTGASPFIAVSVVDYTNQMYFYEILSDSAVASERRLFLRCVNGTRGIDGTAGFDSYPTRRWRVL